MVKGPTRPARKQLDKDHHADGSEQPEGTLGLDGLRPARRNLLPVARLHYYGTKERRPRALVGPAASEQNPDDTPTNLEQDHKPKTITPMDIFNEATGLGATSLEEVLETVQRLKFRERFLGADVPKWQSVTRAYTAYDHFRDYYDSWSKEKYFDYNALYDKDSGLAGALSAYVSRHKHDLPTDLQFIVRRKSVGLTEAKDHGISSPDQAYQVFRDDPKKAHRIAEALKRGLKAS